jgi:hypothetical protein
VSECKCSHCGHIWLPRPSRAPDGPKNCPHCMRKWPAPPEPAGVEAREWWIEFLPGLDDDMRECYKRYVSATPMNNPFGDASEFIHVIEHSAFKRVVQERDELRAEHQAALDVINNETDSHRYRKLLTENHKLHADLAAEKERALHLWDEGAKRVEERDEARAEVERMDQCAHDWQAKFAECAEERDRYRQALERIANQPLSEFSLWSRDKAREALKPSASRENTDADPK